MRPRRVLLATAAALASLAAASGAAEPGAGPRNVRFSASDGARLAGTFIPPKPGRLTFVLLHGVGAGRGEWANLASRLADAGYGSLAVDFRGHGESESPPYTTFRDAAAWARLEKDIEGAVRFLDREGVPDKRVGLIGGSIGANLAVKAASKNTRLAALGLLSPGLDYQGVKIEEDLAKFKRPLIVAAARTDPFAFETVQRLRERVPRGRAVFAHAAHGHGAEMLDEDLIGEILAWAAALSAPKVYR